MFNKQREALEANAKYQKLKLHLQENKKVYLAGAGGATFAGITCLIMRGVASQSISHDTVVATEGAIGVLGKKIVMRNVSFISANRQGPPSWVVRCLETDAIAASQASIAHAMGLSPSHLSQHLNGVRDHVSGYHFERICLAA